MSILFAENVVTIKIVRRITHREKGVGEADWRRIFVLARIMRPEIHRERIIREEERGSRRKLA